VVLDEKGRSNFYDLMAHRGEPRYYAFDLTWLNGVDLCSRPLLIRKARLHRLIPRNDSHLLYVEHLDGGGQQFFELVCEQDLEGIVDLYNYLWVKGPRKKSLGGKVQTPDFPTSLENPARAAGFSLFLPPLPRRICSDFLRAKKNS
jgi:hypothetical protein